MKKTTLDKLLTRAQEVRERAYAPYSNYLVGAAVLAPSGKIFTGCNVENASYGLDGLCGTERDFQSDFGRRTRIHGNRRGDGKWGQPVRGVSAGDL